MVLVFSFFVLSLSLIMLRRAFPSCRRSFSSNARSSVNMNINMHIAVNEQLTNRESSTSSVCTSSSIGLDKLGITNPSKVNRNLSYEDLMLHEKLNGEGMPLFRVMQCVHVHKTPQTHLNAGDACLNMIPSPYIHVSAYTFHYYMFDPPSIWNAFILTSTSTHLHLFLQGSSQTMVHLQLILVSLPEEVPTTSGLFSKHPLLIIFGGVMLTNPLLPMFSTTYTQNASSIIILSMTSMCSMDIVVHHRKLGKMFDLSLVCIHVFEL